jgi:hypothetical protein
LTRFKLWARSRILTNNPNPVIGSERIRSEELAEIKLKLQTLGLTCDENGYYLDINPKPDESKALEAKFASEYREIINKFGFLSPAAMVIGDYVRFYMMRYKSDDPVKRKQCEDGLIAEKSFDLFMQDMGLYVNYPEPIRDWRPDHPWDFSIPLLGKIETKSTTHFSDNYRINVPRKRFLEEKPDYLVGLQHIGGRYIILIGAMRSETVKSYDAAYNGEYYIESGNPPFWSIPVKHLNIPSWKLMQSLDDIKRTIDKMPKRELYAKSR